MHTGKGGDREYDTLLLFKGSTRYTSNKFHNLREYQLLHTKEMEKGRGGAKLAYMLYSVK
jgi:hypothetical protein